MTEEENKAIKNVKKFVYSILNGISANDCKMLLNYTDRLQKQLEKKDKVIDLMAKYLNENNREFWQDSIEEIKDYFYKQVEEEDE